MDQDVKDKNDREVKKDGKESERNTKRRSSFHANSDGASSLLKKLTPKFKRSTIDFNENVDPVHWTTTSATSLAADRQGSQKSLNDDHHVPEWYQELSDDQVTAFKEVFDVLDSNHTGSLNPDNLYQGLRRVDSDITREEVENVLKHLDKDGNGEIDFEEFLFHICQTTEDEEKGAGKRRSAFTERQKLFYSAITEFSVKRTLADIERAQLAHNKQPHVLEHYTAGARLIGLTDRQLAMEMKKFKKKMKRQDSPYAEPLQLVVKTGDKKSVRKQIIPRMKPSQTAAPDIPEVGLLDALFSMEEEPSQSFPTITKCITESFRLLTTKGSVLSKLPGAHKVLQLRGKMASDMVAEVEMTSDQASQVRAATAPPLKTSPGPEEKPKKPRTRRGTGWIIPRVDRDKVPLPELKIKYKYHKPTMEDLPNIRQKVAKAINDYYESLRRATVKNAWDHWDKLYSHDIRSHRLMENFRQVYRAYSPHKEEEAFVVCPWVPGPFRHINHNLRCQTADMCCKQPRIQPDSCMYDAYRGSSGRSSPERRPATAFE